MKFKSNFLVITLICATLHSCENNDVEAFKEDSKQSLRVKEIVSYKNNVENEKVIFSYMGEKLDKIIFYNGNANQWLESSMNEFNYDGNLITNLTSYKNSSKWITEKKVEMRLNNNSIFESIEYTYQLNTWKPIYKSLYQYSGDRLLSWQGFGEIDKNGNLAQNQKGEFSYGGGKISQYIDYILIESSNWQLSEKHTCSYTEDKIKDIKGYFYNISTKSWEHYIESIFVWHQNLISEIHFKKYNENLNFWKTEKYIYKYNNLGYLMEEIRDNDIRITYSYEEGIGNAEILVYDPVQLTMKIPTLKYGSIYANNFLSIYIQDRLKVF